MTDKHNKQENLCTSSERTQNKCPYCKAAFKDDLGYGLRYDCRSVVYKKGKPKESGFCQGRQQARSELSKEIADYLQSSIAAFGEDRTEITNHKDAYDWLRDDVENLIEDLTK